MGPALSEQKMLPVTWTGFLKLAVGFRTGTVRGKPCEGAHCTERFWAPGPDVRPLPHTELPVLLWFLPTSSKHEESETASVDLRSIPRLCTHPRLSKPFRVCNYLVTWSTEKTTGKAALWSDLDGTEGYDRLTCTSQYRRCN